MTQSLRRDLGLAAVGAIVVGDIMGSGIFYTPTELAKIAIAPWQIYFMWGLCGAIVLCGTLTVAELSTIFPKAGATYHMIREGWGPFWGFLKIWIEMFVSGPASVAGGGILFGTFCAQMAGPSVGIPAAVYGSIAIAVLATINLAGVRWGGRTQILLTVIKVSALLTLVCAALLSDPTPAGKSAATIDFSGFIRFIWLGVAAVLFTYDGWLDVTHVAGEVRDPERNLTRGLVLGVMAIITIYMITNHAYLRMVPLEEMQSAPEGMAMTAANRALGSWGGKFLTALMTVSILGSLSGLVMTLPRLFYGAAGDIQKQARADHPVQPLLGAIASVHKRTAVPAVSILFCATFAICAVLFFQTFNRIVNFLIVGMQTVNILAVSSIFRVQRSNSYRMPGYPWIPGIFVATMLFLLAGAIYYHPVDSAIGIGITATGIPFYFWLTRRGK